MLAKVMMNNYFALDFLLASRGGVCAIANILYCIWINGTGEVKQAIHRLKEKTTWLSKVDSHALWGLFSWPELGNWGYWCQSIYRECYLFLVCVCVCVVVVLTLV